MPRAPASLKQHARFPHERSPDARTAAAPGGIRPSLGHVRVLSPTEHTIQGITAALPDDPHHRLAAVADLYGILRRHIAAAIQPAINTLLKEAQATPTLAFAQKRALVQEVNQVLALARLSLLNPQTNLPAKLAAIQPQRVRSGVLRLADSRKAVDGRLHAPAIHTFNLDEAPLQLVEHDPAPPGRPSTLPAQG